MTETGHDACGGSQIAYGEDSHLTPYQEFDYEAVDQSFSKDVSEFDISKFSQDDIDRTLVVMEVLLKWVAQSGMKRPEGVQHRAVIMCWVFLKMMRPLQLTQLATGYGIHKQSLGRWVDDFKRHFPRIRIPHMR